MRFFNHCRVHCTVATRAQILIPVAVAAVVVGVVGILSIPSDAKLESVEFPQGTIKVDDHVLQVQIADTEPRRVRGLMFQEELPYDQGMIFVFDSPYTYGMWMLNVQFPLDMIWFDENGAVVHMEQNVQPCITAVETMACPSVSSNVPALYVLEVKAGFIQEFGITFDSRLSLISI